jgi:hypothetical protein
VIWNEPCSVEQTPVALSSTHAESAAFGVKTGEPMLTRPIELSHFPLWSNEVISLLDFKRQLCTER